MIDLERRRRIEAICDAALDRPARERPPFVLAACEGDAALRREVESLLAHVRTADDFLAEPIDRVAAEVFSPAREPDVSELAPTHAIPAWPFIGLGALIVLRASLFAFALATEQWHANPNRIIPAWLQIPQASLFALLAFVLVKYGHADRRAWSLGLFILDAAATLLLPFVRAIVAPSGVTTLASNVPTDAFQAALLWFFASAFPRPAKSCRLAKLVSIGVTASLCVGVVLAAASVFSAVGADRTSTLYSLASALRHGSSGRDWYFLLQVVLLAPLLLLLPLKLRETNRGDRGRFAWLASGIVIGFAPLTVEVLLVTLFPESAAAAVTARYRRAWGGIIVGAMTVAPVAAAYAALVQRTLDVGLVLRAALQYMLARSFIAVVSIVPLVALVALIVLNRARPVTDLITGGLGATLAVLAMTGAVTATMRPRLKAALDSRFFRQEVDAKAALLTIVDAVRAASSLDAFRDTLVSAIDEAFHPTAIATAVVGANGDLQALDADLDPLSGGSPLVQLLGGNDAPILVDPRRSALLLRLPCGDREWLARSKAALLLPLRGVDGALFGVAALGAKKNELPYTADDQRLLTALGTASGFVLDRIARRAADVKPLERVEDPPARECIECGAVVHHDAIACQCGGLVQRASVPYRLSDKLQFAKRIGQGGVGVVYQAVDLRLEQPRAVKTLPGTDPVVMARLRREARSMAAVQHPNLAILHGLELWRDAPLLVMEYFDGTLADRLEHGPLSFDDTLRVGVELSRGLAALHAAGFLHRDVKPSNIGFTTAGVAKLLDFGLAKLVRTAGPVAVGDGSDDSTWSVSIATGSGAIPGTPAYLSPWILGGSPPSARDDLWSLSVTLLEACTGINPFRAPTIPATIARVLTENGRVAETASGLPAVAQQLFADLLTTRSSRIDSAQVYTNRLQTCSV